MTERLTIDGSHGEGGGQILRTALALSATGGQSVLLERIRARRDPPGLRPQHLAAVRALGQICQAHIEGDVLGSRTLLFEPASPPQGGSYRFDISELAGSPSAGSVTLLFQALLIPLALAATDSRVTLCGGTHTRWSPPYHYLTEVYLPLMRRIGYSAELSLEQWGWYPRGGGQVEATIRSIVDVQHLRAIDIRDRGKLLAVRGLSAASNLPEHVAQRQREQALQRLRSRHIKGEIEIVAAPSPGPGTALFLAAEYEGITAGFTGYGRLRYPAEKVADDAFEALDAHRQSKAALDPHLADQIILPLALAPTPSTFTTSEISRHLLTVSWVVQQFALRDQEPTREPGLTRESELASGFTLAQAIQIEGEVGQPGRVTIG